jgi:hypothetical protein
MYEERNKSGVHQKMTFNISSYSNHGDKCDLGILRLAVSARRDHADIHIKCPLSISAFNQNCKEKFQ